MFKKNLFYWPYLFLAFLYLLPARRWIFSRTRNRNTVSFFFRSVAARQDNINTMVEYIENGRKEKPKRKKNKKKS